MVRIRRGDIWFADLGMPQEPEPGFARPVLVVKDNHYNDSKLATVIVLSLTSHMGRARYPGNVVLSSGESGLSKDCVINVTQLSTINTSQLFEHVGSAPQLILDQVEYGIALVLGMK